MGLKPVCLTGDNARQCEPVAPEGVAKSALSAQVSRRLDVHSRRISALRRTLDAPPFVAP
jgi:hypothetical protein